MKNKLKINRNKRWLCICVLALLTLGCKKDAVPEITGIRKIEPLPYFPVYPGSHWTYLDSNGDTSRIETGPDYIEDEATYHISTYDEKALVPVYNGIPIWGYSARKGGGNDMPFHVWLSEDIPVGGDWMVEHYQASSVNRRIVGKDETVIVAGTTYYPVIIVEEYNGQAPVAGQLRERFYFAKNVGIVKIEHNNPVNNTEVITTSELIEYKINK